jgi:hypothetical protein
MALLLLPLRAPATAQPADTAQQLPADFVANRVYVTAVTTDGDSLRLLTDSGGGRLFVLTASAQSRIGQTITDTLSQGSRSFPVTDTPSFRTDGPVPSPASERTLVAPSRRARLVGYDDGRLGQRWFGDRIWTLDYGAKTFSLLSSSDALSFPSDHTIPLAFQTNAEGTRTNHHPRIEATIADSTYSFLLDTGATTVLTDSAHAALGGPKRRGTGFISSSVFEQWRTDHPDWRVVEGASPAFRGTPLIRVPEVTIAGHTVGPVWFERRPDRILQRTLAGSMDAPVAGAVGGSLFQYFRLTIDYPGARAHFERLE